MTTYKVGNYIKYEEEFYNVTDIKLNFGIQEKLEIEYINFKKKEKEKERGKKIISTSEKSLTLIATIIQPKLIPWLKFTDRYDNTVSYLNKKKVLLLHHWIVKMPKKILAYIYLNVN